MLPPYFLMFPLAPWLLAARIPMAVLACRELPQDFVSAEIIRFPVERVRASRRLGAA